LTVQQSLAKIIEGLNLDLANEYSALIQYIQHAASLTGPEYFAIISELEKHAEQERGHAVIVSDLINYLGGTPTVQAGARLTSPDNHEMLSQDLQSEYDAIRRYNERIAQFESLGLYDSAQKIRDIAKEEQEHAIDLEIALGISRKIPTIPHLQKVYTDNKPDGENKLYRNY
jgi:bacterioferritin